MIFICLYYCDLTFFQIIDYEKMVPHFIESMLTNAINKKRVVHIICRSRMLRGDIRIQRYHELSVYQQPIKTEIEWKYIIMQKSVLCMAQKSVFHLYRTTLTRTLFHLKLYCFGKAEQPFQNCMVLLYTPSTTLSKQTVQLYRKRCGFK